MRLHFADMPLLDPGLAGLGRGPAHEASTSASRLNKSQTLREAPEIKTLTRSARLPRTLVRFRQSIFAAAQMGGSAP